MSTRAERTMTLSNIRHWVVVAVVLWVLTFALGLVMRASSSLTTGTFGLDRSINAAHSPLLDAVALAFDKLDKVSVVAVFLIVLVVIGGLLAGWIRAIGAAIASGLGWLLCLIPKQLVHEVRPPAGALAHHLDAGRATLSYPSGHVVFAVTFVIAVLSLMRPGALRWFVGLVGLVFVVVTMWARLYVGAHYPLDVIGALLAGIAGAVLVIGLWNAVVGRRGSGARSLR